MSLPSDKAEVIGKRALEVAHKNGLNPMAICVLNSAGNCLYSKMEDNNPLFRENIARGKAIGALGLGVDSAAMVKMHEARPHFFQALYGSFQLVPVAGGVLIRDPTTNAVVGAVGMSGDVSEKDEWCCIEGIKSAGFTCAALKEKREPFLKAHL